MAVQVFGGGVQHDIGAEFERLLEVGRGERVVHDEQRAGFARDLAGRSEVAQPHHGIRRRLGVHDLRVGIHGSGHRLGVAPVHERERDAQARPDLGHLPVRPAVHVFAAHHVIACGQQFHDRIERRQTRSKREPVKPAFQRSHVTLERLASRIAGARILEAFVAAESVLDIRGRLVDRSHDRATEGIT